MDIRKELLHEDLQSSYAGLMAFTAAFKVRLFRRIFDWVTKRNLVGKDIDDLHCDEVYIPCAQSDREIRVRIYRPLSAATALPAMLYLHGGGYIGGVPEASAEAIRQFIHKKSCVVIAPDYRKAGDHPYPAALDDCHQTLRWASRYAEELGILNRKFIIAGHSAGGGLTAALTLKLRESDDIDIAFQMPIYPMIDDRQPEDPNRAIASPVWDTALNRIGWSQYLKDLHLAGEDIPEHAAPARCTDYRGLPPTISFVGTCEPFYWEVVEFMENLERAGGTIRFKVFEGCFHAFELVRSKATISQEAWRFLLTSYAEFYDAYVAGQHS